MTVHLFSCVEERSLESEYKAHLQRIPKKAHCQHGLAFATCWKRVARRSAHRRALGLGQASEGLWEQWKLIANLKSFVYDSSRFSKVIMNLGKILQLSLPCSSSICTCTWHLGPHLRQSHARVNSSSAWVRPVQRQGEEATERPSPGPNPGQLYFFCIVLISLTEYIYLYIVHCPSRT